MEPVAIAAKCPKQMTDPLCAEAALCSRMKSKTVRTLTLLIGAMLSITLRAAEFEAIGKAMPEEGVCLMYSSNSLNMEKYEKKRHEIYGSVLTVSRTSEGLPYLLLSGGEGASFSVQCFFPKDAAPTLVNIVMTMRVIVEGELQGKNGNVLFTGCKLLRTL